MAVEVGGAYVRIRPYVSDDDVRALEALRSLCADIGLAFDRFHDCVTENPGRLVPGPDEGEREVA